MTFAEKQNLLSTIAESIGCLDAAGSEIADHSPNDSVGDLLAARNGINRVLKSFPEATIAAAQVDLESGG